MRSSQINRQKRQGRQERQEKNPFLLLLGVLCGLGALGDSKTGKRGSKVAFALYILLVAGVSCSDRDPKRPSVVVFTAHDHIYSEPILKEFERQTGIEVRAVYDAEAAKTTGLVNRLLARRDSPECDVLWNNEIVQTESLAQQGIIAAYESPSAVRIPTRFRDSQAHWTGFAGRVRVLVYNAQKFPQPPSASLELFTDSKFRGQGAIALPYYGTTFTHICVLREQWGEEKLRDWLKRAKDNETAFAPGNGAVAALVASGERSFGLTDTDDARKEIVAGKPIAVLVVDSPAVLIPNTVALIKNAPNAVEAKRLIDYLLSPEVEKQLAEMGSAQIPLGEDLAEVVTPWDKLVDRRSTAPMPVQKIAADRAKTIEMLRDLGLGQ